MFSPHGAYRGLVEPANSLHFGFDVVWLRNVRGEQSTIHLDLYLQKGKANISCNFLLTFPTSSPNVGICLTSLRLFQGRTLRSSCSGWCCQSSSCSKKCEWHLAQPPRQLGWWVMQPLQYESVWTNIKYIQIELQHVKMAQSLVFIEISLSQVLRKVSSIPVLGARLRQTTNEENVL